MKKYLFLLTIMALALVACGPLKSRVEFGVARDTLFSVEETYGDAWGIFLTHDESVVYCTTDNETGTHAADLLMTHGGEVIITFRHILAGDDEEKWFKNTCESYATYEGGSFYPVKLLSIQPVEARGASNRYELEKLGGEVAGWYDLTERCVGVAEDIMADLTTCRRGG